MRKNLIVFGLIALGMLGSGSAILQNFSYVVMFFIVLYLLDQLHKRMGGNQHVTIKKPLREE